MELKRYYPVQFAGKLCYFTCGRSFDLPLRDVLNEYRSGYKMEPNYETATYNRFSSCNQRSLASAVQRGYAYVIFVTKYHGLLSNYFGKYFITGFYEIGWTGMFLNRVYIKAIDLAFVSIEDAWEITPQRWKQICPLTTKNELINLRGCTQTLRGDLLNIIVSQLRDRNKLANYLQEIASIERKRK